MIRLISADRATSLSSGRCRTVLAGFVRRSRGRGRHVMCELASGSAIRTELRDVTTSRTPTLGQLPVLDMGKA